MEMNDGILFKVEARVCLKFSDKVKTTSDNGPRESVHRPVESFFHQKCS